MILHLVKEEKCAEKILVSQDIHTKHRLVSFIYRYRQRNLDFREKIELLISGKIWRPWIQICYELCARSNAFEGN